LKAISTLAASKPNAKYDIEAKEAARPSRLTGNKKRCLPGLLRSVGAVKKDGGPFIQRKTKVASHADTSLCVGHLHQIWEEVGVSDDERHKTWIQMNQEFLDIYKRKIDQAAKSRACFPQVSESANCYALEQLLEHIWCDCVKDDERNKILRQIDEECLDVFKRKVDEASKTRADLHQELADAKIELARLASGKKTVPDKSTGTIKEQLAAIYLQLEHLGSTLQEVLPSKSSIEGFMQTVGELCYVLGMDSVRILHEVHPSLTGLRSESINNETLSKLTNILQELAEQLLCMWEMMDTSPEERSKFTYVTDCIEATVDNVTTYGALDLDLINEAQDELRRLQDKYHNLKEFPRTESITFPKGFFSNI
ncbi:hypothetical protein MKW94_017602, partial [Papaver nudicaule]|nr:hypothetical protein [Papaver nudicaule]